MRTKTVTRHYCEHCGKGMFKRDAMARHEARCYRNPKRTCERCKNDPWRAISTERFEAVARGLVDCRPIKGECPDCFMAVVIQHNTHLDEESKFHGEFRYYDREQFQKDREAWDAENQPASDYTGQPFFP